VFSDTFVLFVPFVLNKMRNANTVMQEEARSLSRGIQLQCQFRKHGMRKLLKELLKFGIVYLIVQQLFSWHAFKTFPKEEIDALFRPITSRYGIKIVYEIGDVFFQKGFVSKYGVTNFNNDFSEYSAMIFTHPQKFKEIMNQYPRVRGKFEVWLEFYQKIDPIFTQAYFLGE
jgi:hypothetical protein